MTSDEWVPPDSSSLVIQHSSLLQVAPIFRHTSSPPASRPSVPRTKLLDIAHARSGDKGDAVNVGLIARDKRAYPFLREHVTAERVKAHFGPMCEGAVERFELENLGALNFLLHEALGGGGTVSLKLDAQGKTYAAHLLRMEVDVPDDLLQG